MFHRRYMYQMKGSSDIEKISALFLTTDKDNKKNKFCNIRFLKYMRTDNFISKKERNFSLFFVYGHK